MTIREPCNQSIRTRVRALEAGTVYSISGLGVDMNDPEREIDTVVYRTTKGYNVGPGGVTCPVGVGEIKAEVVVAVMAGALTQ